MANNCPNCAQREFMTQEFLESGNPFGFESFESEFMPQESFESYEFGAELGQEVQGNAPTQQAAVQRHRNIHAIMMKTIRAMAQHIKPSNGLLRIRIPARNLTEAASRLGAHPRIIGNLLSSLRQRNARAQLKRTPSGELSELGEMSEAELETPSCPGLTTINTKWWGQEIWLNECHTKNLLDAMKVGGGVAGVCGLAVPHPVVNGACKAIAVAAGLSAAVIGAIDNQGGNRGVIIYRPSVGPVWAWHQ
jgi:hypothetical protein